MLFRAVVYWLGLACHDVHMLIMQLWTKAIGIRCGILPQRGVPELMIVLRGMVYNPAAQGKVLKEVAGVLESDPLAQNIPGAAAASGPAAIAVDPVEPLGQFGRRR